MTPPSATPEAGGRETAPPDVLRGHWLLVARLAWVALAILSVVIFVASVPVGYADILKLNKALSDRSSGLTFDAVNLTVGKYLHHWLEDSVKSLVDAGKMAHSTFIRYEGIVNNHLKPALGHRKLKDLSRAEVRRLYKEKGKALAPRSVDYIHVTLQKALSQAVRDDLIPRNVASGERPAAVATRKRPWLSPPLRYEHCLKRLAESVTRPSILRPSTRDCARVNCLASSGPISTWMEAHSPCAAR